MPWLTFLAGRAEISTAMMKFAPIFFRRADRYGLRQAAVYIFAVADDDRLEHVRNRSGSADSLSGIADVEHHRFAAFKIGRNSSKFDGELLHRAVADFAVDVVLQFFAFDEAAGGQGQIHQIGFTQNFRFQFEAVGRHSRSVHTADNRACGCAGNDFDRNIVFFQNLNNTDMGKAFGRATAQSQRNRGFRFGCSM